MYKRYCKLPFATLFLPKGKSDIKALSFCDIIFVLSTNIIEATFLRSAPPQGGLFSFVYELQIHV